MPWLETSPVDERERFIADDRLGLSPRAELCARYAISRKTGYKWLTRYHEDGRRGLKDRSHALHPCPHRVDRALAELLLGARRKHPDWGPGKLLDWLGPRHPEIAEAEWPAVSTAGDLLTRAGLVTQRRRRRPHQHPGVVPPHTEAPNDLWTTDFKGQFPTQDRIWCYPLTIGDQHTRYLLACRGLPNIKGRGARPVFEHTFRAFGLPRAIRTDNGAHERMHRTLKAGAGRPPRANLATQQRTFNRFRTRYNEERPHEFLGGRTPSSCSTASPRPCPERLPPLEYPGHFLVKRVTNAGTFRLKHTLLFIAHALQQHHLGLDETDDGIWSIDFGTVLLGKVDERDIIIRD